MSQTEVYYYYTDDSPPPVSIVAPAITGTARVGQTLTASTGTWTGDPVSYSYQWYRNGVAIGGATNNTYLLVTGDVGAVMTVTVTATNDAGSESATSAGTSPVLPLVPVAAFSYAHDAAGSRAVQFTDLSTNTPTAWDWDYGDGSAHGTTQNPARTYANDGAYTVTLIASNAGGASAPVNHAISVVGYLFLDEFTTAQAAPIISPRTAEPLGAATIVDTLSRWPIIGGILTATGQTGAFGNPRYFVTTAIARNGGVLLTFRSRRNAALGGTLTFSCGFSTAPSGVVDNNQIRGYYFSTATFQVGQAQGSFATVAIRDGVPASAFLNIRVMLWATGEALFLDNVLVWVNVVNTNTPLYPIFEAYGVGMPTDHESIAVRTQLPAPFQATDGIASVNVTSFTQSLGAELLTNGDFANWTGDNPDGWSVAGEVGSDPMVTQVAPGGGAGTGAARLFASGATSNPILTQSAPPLTIGALYEWAMNVSAYTSGLAIFNNNDAGTFGISASVVGVKEGISRAVNTGVLLRSNTAAHDFVVDSLSVKLVTPNAVHTATADAITDLTAPTPPASVIGQRIENRYRVNALTPTLDYWVYYLECTALNVWNIRLDSVAGGVATNRISVAGFGLGTSTPVTLRAIYEGSLHDIYTLASSTWAKRGAQVNLSHQNTSTGVQAVNSSAVTPTSLKSYPRTAAAYAELDRVRS